MQVERYGHGGDVWTAAEQFGVAREALLDVSANINPLGPPESVVAALQESLVAGIAAYPDPLGRELKAVLVEKVAVASEQIVLGNGAAEVLYGVMRALRPRRVGVMQPCFSEYAAAAEGVGAEVVAVFAREDADYLPARGDLLAVCAKVELFIVGHPNNPNGRFLPLAWLEEMAKVLAARGGSLLVDEAFLDFVPRAPSLLTRVRAGELPSVVLLRSLTKFYAIPGLRLGYAVCAAELARRIERELPPWRVNALALVAGVVGLRDEQFAERTIAWLERERPFLRDGLARLPGVTVYGGEVNYVLFRSENVALQADLGRRGILIRSCAEYPGLGEGFYRVAVWFRQENERLLREMERVLTAERGKAGCPTSW
ncbi:MAG TPA: threonine-phosphate decarboxylase CobD [Bacilli bacterium]|nr:threonine-phosphate decarboxylase CobD [Bacilli bacterium]